MLHLMPMPRSVQWQEGCFSLGLDARIVFDPALGRLARTAADQLQHELREACGVSLPIIAGTGRLGDIVLAAGKEAPQAYTLCIGQDGVLLTAGGGEGLLHGAQTLRQVIRQRGWRLPQGRITDAPVLPERGFYHDVTRGRVPTLDFLMRLADEACHYKLNQLQLYVEHTYLFSNVTELWRKAVTPLTAQDILTLDDYCADRGIELVPSLASFGHLMELLSSRSHAHLCELPGSESMPSTMPNRMAHHTVNVADEEALTAITGLIDEFMPLFRSRRFNVCADETYDLGKGRSREAYPDADERALYMGFLKKLMAHVEARGRKAMFWGDIVLRFPEALTELPEGTLCLNWGYSPFVTEDAARTFHGVGARQYVCPGVNGWNRIIPDYTAAYENISRMAAYGVKYGAVGLLNTDWGDYGHVNDPRLSLPGLIMGAAAAWCGTLPPMKATGQAISRLHLTDDSGRAMALLTDLAECQVYSWYAIVRHKDWTQGTLEEVRRTSPLIAVDDGELTDANARAADIMDDLCACAARMDSTRRPLVSLWLNTAEGVILWNRAAHAARMGETDPALAGQLERWLCRYEQHWREVSREAELWRIRDVAGWYADVLRGAGG